MIKELFFKLVDVIIFFKPDDMTTKQRFMYTDGNECIEYFYGSKVYRTLGTPSLPPSGFFLPIKEAVCDGKNITDLFKIYAGPKCNHVPDTGYIFKRRKPKFTVKIGPKLSFKFEIVYEKGPSKTIHVKNILNQTSAFGAR